MVRLFNRDFVLTVGTRRIRARARSGSEVLRFQFEIEKTLTKDPNKGTLTIYNLSKTSRDAVSEKGAQVTLEAGYVDDTFIIFKGDVERATSSKQGPTWITKLDLGDSTQRFKKARVNLSFKGPVKASDMLKQVGRALGVDVGNLDQAAGSAVRALTQFTNGAVFTGKAEKQFDKVAKSLGLNWTIQDGALLLLGPDQFIGNTIVQLGPDSGLVGTPEVGEQKGQGGRKSPIIKATSLIQPFLNPGNRVNLAAESVQGPHRVQRSVYEGDTRGRPWYVNMELKALA